MTEQEDGLDGILNSVKMGRWQLLAFLINCLGEKISNCVVSLIDLCTSELRQS